MEIWGLCPACESWFFCEGWFDRQQPTPVCPACGLEPRAIENRAAVTLREESSVQSLQERPLFSDAHALSRPNSVQGRRSVIICSHCHRPVMEAPTSRLPASVEGMSSSSGAVGARHA